MPINKRPRHRRGAMLVVCALLLPVLLILASIAINVAYMELSRTELRTATDAATRAAGRTFALTGDQGAAMAAARDAGTRNTVASRPLVLEDDDFQFGTATRPSLTSRYAFTPGGATINSVRIAAQGPVVPRLMTGFLGDPHYQPQQVATSTQVELDVVLVLDRSGSMAYADNEVAIYPPNPAAAPSGWTFCQPVPTPSRWRDLTLGVADFLEILANSPQQEQVGLATYSATASIDVDLTHNYATLSNSLAGMSNAFCGGSTAIGMGLDSGIQTMADRGFDRPWASKIVILMTDGIHNTGHGPLGPAQYAAQRDITVFTITFAQEADQSLMQQVAVAGGGRHYHAASGADLRQVFREIARSLPTILTE